MILWLRSQILEDGLLPVPLHVVPIVNLTMTDRVVDTVSGGLRVRECLVTDEEIKVLDSPLRC